MFTLSSKYAPITDQQNAIDALVDGINKDKAHQLLVGVTGSGKTFVMANVIARTNLPTLIISHNKTLAGQLYQEMRAFFPENAVSYFVSYYDYYQPEAYIPSTDTYIEKEADINATIDKLRLDATTNLLTRMDVVVVASVSCIYNIGSPLEYGKYVLYMTKGEKKTDTDIISRLVQLQYTRSEFDFHRGTFRIRGERIDVYPAYSDEAIRIHLAQGKIKRIESFEPISGQVKKELTKTYIFPAKHYMIDPDVYQSVYSQIMKDMKAQVAVLRSQKKMLEADRLTKKVTYDLELIRELGYVNGIENYSRYFDGRNPGDPPYTLLDYFTHRFGQKWMVIIDESHMTVPQVRGMFNGDLARKKILIDYGFRLPSALDNRPLHFPEFVARVPRTIYTTATPAPYEQEHTEHTIELLVRPTGIPDPQIVVKKTEGCIADLIDEVKKCITEHERVLISTLTKQQAEDLSSYLKEQDIKVEYLHSDVKTLVRSDILKKLRLHTYDVLVGVNLLREGLDIPEVGLVAILDADKTGFLRSKTALIQTMGRAARNVKGRVILYADTPSLAMNQAIDEVSRRRDYQLDYNKKHHIQPTSVQKDAPVDISDEDIENKVVAEDVSALLKKAPSLTPLDKQKEIKKLKKHLSEAVAIMDFEQAIILRDAIRELEIK